MTPSVAGVDILRAAAPVWRNPPHTVPRVGGSFARRSDSIGIASELRPGAFHNVNIERIVKTCAAAAHQLVSTVQMRRDSLAVPHSGIIGLLLR